MKINQNSSIRNSETTVTSQTELQNQSVKAQEPSAENAAGLKQNEAMNLGQQRMAAELKSTSSLTAGILQKSLADALPSRFESLKNAATELIPKLPQMMVRSGTDPDRFISAVREELQPSNFQILGSMNGQDIESIAFIVLMQAAKSAQEDLKSIMDGVKNINKSKEGIRELLIQAQQSSTYRKDDDD